MKPIYKSVPAEYLDEYYDYLDLKALQRKNHQKKGGFRVMYAKAHPVTFAYFMLGIKMRPYQSFMIDLTLRNQMSAYNCARRLGKSTVIGLIALWETYFNLAPKNQIEDFTTVGIVSKESEASKKILRAIRDLIDKGDRNWRDITKGTPYQENNHFSKMMIEPNNSEQITWVNKSSIHSLPPTKKVKGWGFSHLFMDEIAYMDPKDEEADSFFNLTCKPTLADCGGKLTFTSTPAGKSGLYFDLFDPEDKNDIDTARIWFDWRELGEKCDDDNAIMYKQFVLGEKKRLYGEGKEAVFRQEFMGDFTVIQNAFFEPDDVEDYFDNKLVSHYDWHKSPCSIGFDFGISDCLTTITVKTLYQGEILTLYKREFSRGFDNNELMNTNNEDSVQRLMKRYDTHWLVPEDSSVSDMFVKWCIRQGYPVYPYRFSGGNVGTKNTAYHTYRAMLKSGRMRSFPHPLLKSEMLSLQIRQEKINWIISKPPSGTDDSIDSDVFATVPFFDDEGDVFGGFITEPQAGEKEVDGIDITSRGVRYDAGIKALKQDFQRGYVKPLF